MTGRLACFGVVGRSFQLFLLLFNSLFRLWLVSSLVWLALNTAVLSGLAWIVEAARPGFAPVLPPWLPQAVESIFGAGLAGLVFVPFSMLLLRRVVREDPLPGNPLRLFLVARTWRFFAYGLALSLVYMLLTAGVAVALAEIRGSFTPGTAPAWAAVCVLALAAVWVMSRLAPLGLVFPAVALEVPAGFLRAWRLGRGQAWRMLFIQALVWAPSQLAATVLQEYARPYLEADALFSYAVGMGFMAFSLLLTLSLPTIALALIYKELDTPSTDLPYTTA